MSINGNMQELINLILSDDFKDNLIKQVCIPETAKFIIQKTQGRMLVPPLTNVKIYYIVSFFLPLRK